MRRDLNDPLWKATKDTVYKRDNNQCRLLRCLNIKEVLLLKKNAGSFLNILDPAHVVSVSSRPDLCYESNNICVLNRYSHSLLDSYKDPITGKSISAEEVKAWWLKILNTNKEQYKYLEDNKILEEL